ncbi:MAG TPA: amidohydrolase family protein [Candidatus Limnocylindria bacterium]|nr:amidohydrolase family protein [Candidatus Limnocylindria bacterium]
MDLTRAERSLTVHGTVLTDGHESAATTVKIVGGLITSVMTGASADGADIVVDGWIVPGLIDLQLNGAGGIDLTSHPRPDDAVESVARVLPRHGVTAFCPTVISSPPAPLLERLGPYRPRDHVDGAASLGAHLEGPFLSAAHRGAHDATSLREPDEREVERWLSVCRPSIVTIAPELPNAFDAIRRLAAAGTIVSLGHSGADLETARSALSAGATMGTHLFNGMPPLHHRSPGLVGALLSSSATIGLICDGVHVHPMIAELVIHVAGIERVALVSDAVAPAGLATSHAAADGVRRVDSTLVGSAVLLDACLRTVRSAMTWLTPAQVVLMATGTPAAALGHAVASRKGRIASGYDADLTILDSDWRVMTTIIGGRVVFSA